jgi:hypothetical protein
MIYAVEIDQKNAALAALRIFLHTGVSPTHVACADSLEFTYWGNMMFHYIIGNPPYNPPKDMSVAGAGGRNRLWDRFLMLDRTRLLPGGYLLLVHPSGWRKPNDKLYPDMTRTGTFTSITMYDSAAVMKMMKAGIPVDAYCWRKGTPNGLTTIVDVRGETTMIDLTPSNPDRPAFLLNFGQARYTPMADYADDDSRVRFSRRLFATDNTAVMSETQDHTFKYPCVHAVSKDVTRHAWSSRQTDKHGNKVFFGEPKQIIGDQIHVYRVELDRSGDYGLTQHAIGFPIAGMTEEEIALRGKMLASDEFNEFLQAALWSTTGLDWRLFKHLRPDWYKILPSCK